MKQLFIGTIKFYKLCISPFLPKRCIYIPSCSSYTLTAIERFGAFRGTLMGAYRLARCNPFAKGGIDPVPDNPKGEMRWLM